jgi:hypothetical protein
MCPGNSTPALGSSDDGTLSRLLTGSAATPGAATPGGHGISRRQPPYDVNGSAHREDLRHAPAPPDPEDGHSRERRRRTTGTGTIPVELTSFVGRRREVGEVKRLLAKSRLVTLTGIGGVGKTRLSLRVAAEVRRAFRDGVWFVDLSVLRNTSLLTSEVPDPQLLAQLVAASLGIREQTGGSALETLTNYVRARNLLLLLDNCEHLVERAAMLVDTLLSSSAGIRVLTTSREPLGIVGETLYIVPPLAVPGPRDSVSQRTNCESVALLLARGESILGFRLERVSKGG